MRITLKSNMGLGGPFSAGVMELGGEEASLRAILNEISKRCGVEFVDPKTGEVKSVYDVSVNGREYWLLPNRLDTELHNEVDVKVDVIMLGGG